MSGKKKIYSRDPDKKQSQYGFQGNSREDYGYDASFDPEYDNEINSSEVGKKNSGNLIPDDLMNKMELLFGYDFSLVKIHKDSERAVDIEALAFTEGKDIYFAPGEFRPDTSEGQELIAHELTHVVQQASGKVSALKNTNGIAINDDPSLEQEADKMGRMAALTPPSSDEETSHSDLHSGNNAIQRQEKEVEYIPIKIYFDRDISMEELGVLAEVQVIGSQVGLTWENGKASYKKEESPVTFKFRKATLIKYRILDRDDLGAKMDESGEITGSGKRAEDFNKMKLGPLKDQLNKEIDKRYHDLTGTDANEKIKDPKKEKDKVAAWNIMRDEVLAEKEKLEELPDHIKNFLSGGKKEFSPDEYRQLLRIANKLTLEEWLEYIKRVNASDDLDAVEASVNRFKQERAKREEDQAKLHEIKTKLYGAEELFKRYKEYKEKELAAMGTTVAVPYAAAPVYVPPLQFQVDEAGQLKKNLTDSLIIAGFKGGIPEFEKYIIDFEEAFRKETVGIADDSLDYYDHMLFKEEQKYQDDAHVDALYNQLGGVRKEYVAVQGINGQLKKIYDRMETLRLPGNSNFEEYDELNKQKDQLLEDGKNHMDAAKAEAAKVSITDPLMKEDNLPQEKRLDKEKLAQADRKELKALLLAHIKERREDVRDTKQNLKDDSMIIYGFDKLMVSSYEQQHIAKDSIFWQIIEDKKSREHSKHIVKAVLVAVVAIALGLLTFGTGTIAVAAAAASFGLSAYQAYEEFREYERNSAGAGAGLLSDDPSIIWVIVAVAGAGLDLAMVGSSVKALKAVKEVEAIKPLAKSLEATGDVAAFEKGIQALTDAGTIEARVAQSVIDANNARKGFNKASKSLLSALTGKMYSFPGPFTDPDVYKALVKMAYYKAKEGLKEFSIFVDQIKLARAEAKLGEMTAEELAKLKQAFEEGQNAFKNNPKVFEEALDLAKLKKTTEEIAERLKGRINAEPGRFELKLTDDQISTAVKEGKLKGLDDKTIEDIIFQGSRKEKADTFEEIVEQMAKTAEIDAQGYPAIFKSLDEFSKFKNDVVKASLKKLGLPVNDVRIQGSLARKTNLDKIGDIDIGIIVNKSDFDKWVEHFMGLSNLPKKKQALLKGMESGIIKASEMVFENTKGGAMGMLYEQYKIILGAEAPKKMQLSIILEGGKFDLSPYIKF